MASAIVRRYWTRLVADGCCICGAPAEVAHCHGGSIVERMREPKAKGKKMARYDWLVLPLCPRHGRNPYPTALDTDVAAWESSFGSQAAWVDDFAHKHGLDLWVLAQQGRK